MAKYKSITSFAFSEEINVLLKDAPDGCRVPCSIAGRYGLVTQMEKIIQVRIIFSISIKENTLLNVL